MKICVLLGGASPERIVSLHSGTAIAQALESMGHEILFLDPATPLCDMDIFRKSLDTISMKDMDFKTMSELRDHYFIDHIPYLKKENVKLVFNALHGENGENGVISAVLDIAGIPYTGSGFEASAIAMDKYKTKILVGSVGVKCAAGELHHTPIHHPDTVSFPLVVKPNNSGSSMGLAVFLEETDLYEATSEALKFSDEVIIESYIPGGEYNIPVIKGEAFPIVKVNPHGVNDYKAKYMGDKTEYTVPAPLDDVITKRMQDYAVKVYKVLGLKNYARIDFRMTPDKEIYLLEANTLPGMTATSLVPKSAKALGIGFPELLEIIIEDALN
ncbi:MAG: D-alanine--D-alanine ligase [Candidatus Marinimicrobia bacterium]|nr:D-alanine--D-alanine ligase [Candidatus Neomarinimicrobiota bacterium]